MTWFTAIFKKFYPQMFSLVSEHPKRVLDQEECPYRPQKTNGIFHTKMFEMRTGSENMCESKSHESV